MSAVAYGAAWIFPVAAPPIADGVIECDDAGTIVSLRSGSDRDAIDLGDVAVVPALVNPHCHLEFSDFTEPPGPPRPFPDWVRRVVAHRRARVEPDAVLIGRGVRETRRGGVGAVGDILTGSLAAEPYPHGGPHVVAFREMIGPVSESWPTLLAAAERHLSAPCASHITRGLSPHAPYTVPQELFEQAVALAARYAAPLAVHLAETAAERGLLRDGTGELVALMASLGLWRPELHPRGRTPLDWLKSLAALPAAAAVVHGNFLDDAEVDFLAAHPHMILIYCPRTHHWFGHPPHPWRRLLDAGGRVAFGTDGRSSNPDLSLWSEATFLRRRHPDVPCATLLDGVTRRAAEAIGLGDFYGVLAPGRRADFLTVRLGAASDGAPPDLFGVGGGVERIFRGGVDVTESERDATS